MGKNREKGVAAVEFALILPLLLLVLFMIIEFSIALYDKAVITNASREGARSGIVNASAGSRPTAGAIAAVVNSYCGSNLISFGPSAPATAVSAACVNPGDLLTVNVTYTYDFLVLPNFMGSLPTGLTLTGNTVMRCE
jgi:Flp pilus assembly protein TadG